MRANGAYVWHEHPRALQINSSALNCLLLLQHAYVYMTMEHAKVEGSNNNPLLVFAHSTVTAVSPGRLLQHHANFASSRRIAPSCAALGC
jgi:hypothetical protein